MILCPLTWFDWIKKNWPTCRHLVLKNHNCPWCWTDQCRVFMEQLQKEQRGNQQ